MSDKESSDELAAVRCYAGVRVCGPRLEVTVNPMADGRLAVYVDALPTATPYARAVRLGQSEAQRYFRPGEIRVDGERLECLAASDCLPAFREGFSLALDPGMGQLLAHWLPGLTRVADISAAISQRVAALVSRPIAHVEDFITGVVALVVLDGLAPERALAVQQRAHWAGQEVWLLDALDHDQLRTLLAEAALNEERSDA